MAEEKSSNITWQNGKVSAFERQKLLNQTPITLWLSGLSGAGKSTLAFLLERKLVARGHACYVLDGDNVRHGLSHDLGFNDRDRSENIRRIAEVSRLMNDAGLIVITALISPLKSDRDMARTIIGEKAYREIFVSTSIEVCESRDPKDLYKKARQGFVKDFTGISAPYEAPINPTLILDTERKSKEDCVDEIMQCFFET
jgi:adenylyl-sulfate kinase